VAVLPATGSQIAMGRVYSAYTNAAYPTAAGTAVRLNATLGVSYGGKAAAAATAFSATFGGKTTPYAYP
jgi:hypothetical protein